MPGTESETRTYDVVVLGAGAVGENVADRASRTGLTVLIVESELVGGECSYWACMPSKALLRAGAALAAARAVRGAAQAVTGDVDAAEVLARRDTIVHGWDDQGQVDWLDGAGIDLLRGRARFTAPRLLEVTDDGGDVTTVEARHAVVVATGSEPVIPPIPGLAESEPWTSREATSVQDLPASLAIIGGGVVGVEMATAFADLGAHVTLLVRGDSVLVGMEPYARTAVAEGLTALGVDVRFGTEVTRAVRDDHGVTLTLSAGAPVVAEQVLVAAGRRPRTGDLGVAAIGLEPGASLAVDGSLRVTAVDGEWLYAAGDVTGRVATTHQGKYDARIVGDVVATRFGSGADAGSVGTAPAWSKFRASADDEAVPQVVFTRPEVAAVGLTEAAARAAGYPVRTVEVDLASLAGSTVAVDDYRGTASIVVDSDREVILGATFVGPDVAELLHSATIAIVGQVPLSRLWHAVPAYPTVSEVWLRFLEGYGL